MRSRTEVFGPNGTASLRSPRKLLSPWRLYGVQFPFPAPTKKELLSTKSSFFVYPSRRLGISSRRSRGYHQGRRAALVSHQTLWVWIFQRLDGIQHFVLMIYRNKLRMIYKAM